jgi:GNAT superfamily N-acetyltransferase
VPSTAVESPVLQIRAIRPDDRSRILGALAYTSDATYYQRFHGHRKGFSERELDYLTEVDGDEHCALIATERDRPDLLVAIARFVRTAPGSAEAELAITVHDPYQGHGVGRRMLELLAAAARERGVERLRAVVQHGNHAMIRLMHSVLPATVLDLRDGSTLEYVADL